MKSKAVPVLLVVFIALLAVVLFLKPKVSDEAEMKLVDLKPEDVHKISLTKGADVLAFEKDDTGEWVITRPLAAQADSFEVSRLAEDFASLKIEKVVEAQSGDPARFGIPQAEVSVWAKGIDEPVTIAVGSENPLDKTLYAQKKGDPRVVLLPALLKSTLDKKLLDFRQKDIFRFETAQAGSIRVKSKDINWEAAAREGEWFLQKPVAGLAQKTQIEAVLNTLSGLRAKDFVSEQKTGPDMKKFGLDKPDFEVAVSLPPAGQNIVFLVRKMEDKVYVTTAASNKIVQAEEQLLTDLEKKPETLREKRAAVFNAWEADQLQIRRDGLSLAVSKQQGGQWIFLSGESGPADDSKVETFLRQVGNLEAAELIDTPGSPASYGLDKPRAEVKIQAQAEDGKKQETVLILGAEDPAAKQMVIKNPKFAYLFRVNSAFLEEFPKAAADWKKQEPKDKK
ncbi:MAG: DUF4340 domain-containing protein [Candidatus Aminicenantes bacterium]|nr:DUF4340 domain-containing protein [Candidatus Aminicenantes bacterium]